MMVTASVVNAQGTVLIRAQLDTNLLKSLKFKPEKIYKVENATVSSIPVTAKNLQLTQLENQKILYINNETSSVDSRDVPKSNEFKPKAKALNTYYLARTVENTVTLLKPRIYFDEKMKYNKAQGEFRGSISIVLYDSLNPGSSVKLKEPIKLAVKSDADAITPENLSINHTNLPLEDIQFSEDRPHAGELIFRVITQANLDGYQASLDIEPHLVFREGKRLARLQGLGLGTKEVFLSVMGLDNSETLKVSLDISKGSLSATTLSLKAGEEKSILVRSEGIGTASLMAHSKYGNDEMSLNYIFPIWYLIASALGSLLAGAARWVYTKGKQGNIWSHLALGLVGGIIIAFAYSLGFSALIEKITGGMVPMYAFNNEALIIVVSFIGGLSFNFLVGLFTPSKGA